MTLSSAVFLESVDFLRYVSRFGKNYASLEQFEMRKALFLSVDSEIKEWNSKEGITSFMGHNFMSDYTPAERKALRS